ncbi:hypothetical protein [Blastococcus sp. SYSU DS0617]
MRVGSVVLPAVLAIAAAVLAPTSAQAAPAQCGLQLPTKVVIDAPRVDADMRLTNGCWSNGATSATWDMVVRGVVAGPIEFDQDDFDEDPDLYAWWDDTDPMGKWTLTPRGAVATGNAPLSQNTAVTLVKYGSRLATKVTRSGSSVS